MIPVLSLLVLASASNVRASVTPVQQVINMMQDMVAKGKQEKHDETVRFSTFKQWCEDTTDEKQASIADSKARIEQLQADIQKAQADQLKLGDEIKVLQSNIAGWTSDKEAATADRKQEKADYDALHQDYSESLDALDRAINVLSKQSGDVRQNLMQVQALKRIPDHAKRVIESFLNTQQSPLDVTAPEANAYEFQSGGIVEMLEKLKGKFAKELHGYEKEEMTNKHNFEMLIQELTDSIDNASAEESKKTKLKAKRASDEGAAKGELGATQADLAEDEKYLQDMTTECGQKSQDFEARQTLRAEEIEALNKAIEIISSGDVSGNSETYLPQLLQTKSSTTKSFAFLQSVSMSPAQKKCAAFLQGKAQQTKSKLLAMVAAKATADPFGKVKGMIKDLIVKLMEEANDEAEHKGWCDTEMSTNKQTREDKADQVDTLTAQSEELTAQIAKLSSEITDLSDSVAALDKAMAEATALRTEEKAKNAQTVKDAQAAQVAVAQALQVLKEFYAMASEATALVQQTPGEDAPATFDKPYRGMGGSSTGVVGMIEVIASDFARLEAETNTSESEAAEQYQKFSDESAQDKAVKNMDIENKSKDRTTAESDLSDTKKDLEATQAELDAALAYFEKLKPSCVDMNLSYEDRVKQREEEIQSLNEALRILDGNDIA
jgi:predicted  nucleic acid-binding Zn-ribbon protein